MIDTKVTIKDETQNVVKAIDKAAYRSFAHAGASIRKDAQASIKRAPRKRRKKGQRGRVPTEPSPVGQPVHTRSGQARRAIVYAASKEDVVVGPRFSVMGVAMEAHEKGIVYKGTDYEERAVMVPAMERGLPRFAASWGGALG